MTRAAAEAGIERFVDTAIEATVDEFSVARALRGGVRGPGGGLVDRLLANNDAVHRYVVRPELDRYRDRILRQYDLVLDYAGDDEPFEAYADELLAVDSYWAALRDDVGADRRAAVREAVLGRHRRLGERLAPLVASPRDVFWPAVADAYDREAARELVEETVAFTGPLLDHRGAFRFETAFDAGEVLGAGPLGRALPTVRVDYTDEAVRAMRRGEQRVRRDVVRELERELT